MAKKTRAGREAPIPDLTALSRDPEAWWAVDRRELKRLLLVMTLTSGSKTDLMTRVYAGRAWEIGVKRIPVQERQRLLMLVTEAIESGEAEPDALETIVRHDDDLAVVSTAALNLAVLHPLAGGDPLTGPARLRVLAESLPSASGQQQRTGILIGLVALGDRRVLPLLHGSWALLDSAHQKQLANAETLSVSAMKIDFLLGWLDDLLQRGDDALFGHVAGSLASVALRVGPRGRIVDLERVFPATSMPRNRGLRTLAEWSLAEYTPLIAPRLRDLAARESEPKVIPEVMRYWGVAEWKVDS